MAEISFVYFDLDDTLLDHRRAERLALGDVYDFYSHVFDGHRLLSVQDTYHEVNTDVWRRYGDGLISKQQAKLERFELLLERLLLTGRIPALDLSTRYMSHYREHWSFIPGGRDAFLSIADSFQVGILTNGFTETQKAKLAQFPELGERSSSIVISEEVGYMKPDPRIFDHAASAVNCAPDEILYIGDSYRSDVLGGRRAGWNVAWFCPGDEDGKPERRFQEWSEILTWMDVPSR
ncbi:MAG: HAD-IA family hydrolase [Rhodothermia bacterium]|nr:MAG: HAD-IA family hydrolase [Rhodothermia bacterium]